jgi:flavoprotein
MKLQFTNVSSAGIDYHVRLICPHCNTLCRMILRFFAPHKRLNGVFWKCATLDCPFELKANSKQAQVAMMDFLAERRRELMHSEPIDILKKPPTRQAD